MTVYYSIFCVDRIKRFFENQSDIWSDFGPFDIDIVL
jgi:hypothetical protein